MAKLRIIVGTGNEHKLREIRQILGDLDGVELVGLSAFTDTPDIDEDADTFEGNAKKKALEIAQFIALQSSVGYAGRGVDRETDFEAISARRHRARSGRHKPVKLSSDSERSQPKGPLNVLVLADDSGLEIDALNGAPGVRSARYAGTHGDDAANNRLVLEKLKDVPEAERTARFVCAMALADPQDVHFCVRGTVEGTIAEAPRGSNGFGYDPLFYHAATGKTFGEIDSDKKNALSHRHNALLLVRRELEKLLASR